MYDALTTPVHVRVPGARGGARRAVVASAGSSGCPAPRIRPSTGSSSPARCGDEHLGLVSHDELDWAPLGLDRAATFLNLMTSRLDPLGDELAELAARRIKAGEWPWSFFCYPEERPRPVFPSAFLAARAGRRGRVGVAVRCPVCARVSVNLVSARSTSTCRSTTTARSASSSTSSRTTPSTVVEEFAAELYSARFDGRRLTLE